MGKHRHPSDESPPEVVTGDPGATYWSVAEADWPELRPSLPAELVDLLAPPIVVGVARVAASSRLAPPADPVAGPRPAGAARAVTPAGRPVPPGATTVRLGPAAGPSHPAGPAGPVPGRRPSTPAPGRHRSPHPPADRNG
ncbi:hypothetical protein K7640_15385 [Micromonospora sp. PLK6-60]|uniref:hypothetical protein n=1 Tax=Micromonospora sp. PLK6-60 TaxID=2873383 RepID=UPI001CA7AB54|nr:hypothetical protein [Micromonospora sp. PLK6-60]MBY8873218.1 hypothetical protein [Micromonospora sp. PLK6-60]